MAQQVFNGKTITIDSDEDIIPVYYDDSGEVKAAGRTDFWFVLISGSVRTTVGASLDESPADTPWSTAGDKWFHTASPSLNTLEDGFYGNLRADGSGVVRVLW